MGWLSVLRGKRGRGTRGTAEYGEQLVEQGNLVEAERYLGDLLRNLETETPTDREEMFTARLALGEALLGLGRAAEAAPVYALAIGGADRQEASAVAAARVRLVLALLKSTRFSEAVAEARDLRDACARHRDDEEISVTLHSLTWVLAATALGAWGRHAEALAEIEAMPSASGQVRELGRSVRVHELTMLGRAAEALVDAREIAADAVRAAESDDRKAMEWVVDSVSRLAVTLIECGRAAEAETELRAALARTSRWHNLRLRSELVFALNGQGRHADALAALEALPHIDAAAPADNDYRARWALYRAEALYGLGRRAEAGAAAERALSEAAAWVGPTHFVTARIQTLLAATRDDTP